MLMKSKNTRVKLEGKFAATHADIYQMPGCTHNTPCNVYWQNHASKVKINGSPAILETSNGFFRPNEKITGLTLYQRRVKGT